MGLSQDVLEKVYSLVQRILTQNTFLFFNRHIDQIILCSIYGVSKVHSPFVYLLQNLSIWFATLICQEE